MTTRLFHLIEALAIGFFPLVGLCAYLDWYDSELAYAEFRLAVHEHKTSEAAHAMVVDRAVKWGMSRLQAAEVLNDTVRVEVVTDLPAKGMVKQ